LSALGDSAGADVERARMALPRDPVGGFNPTRLTGVNALAAVLTENAGNSQEIGMSLSEQQVAGLLAGMRERLAVLEEEIGRKLGDSADDLSMLDRVGDSGDFSNAIASSEVDLSEALRDIEEWRGLRGAMRRIDEGRYGFCVDCGVEIPFARLQAQPVALRCVDCQSRAERSSGAHSSTM
jgi:RNA polymerase-binding transcription factor DksA